MLLFRMHFAYLFDDCFPIKRRCLVANQTLHFYQLLCTVCLFLSIEMLLPLLGVASLAAIYVDWVY